MTLSTALAAAAGLAPADLAGQSAATPAATPPDAGPPDDSPPQGAGFYRFGLGDFRLLVVSDGDAPFPAWPLWSRNAPESDMEAVLRGHFLPTDHVTVHCNALLVDTGRERVLVDPGAGPSMGPRFGRLVANLRRAGVDPASVTVVVTSHGHNDHFHGVLADGERADDGRAGGGRLVFPNARYVWPEAEWRYWTSDAAARDAMALALPEPVRAGMVRSARLVLPRIADRTERAAAAAEVVPGVTLVPAPGHTPAQAAVLVHSGVAQLLYAADVLHLTHSTFAHPEWAPAFDHLPDVAVRTRRALLDRAAADRTLVMGYHFPFPALGHVHGRAPLGSGAGIGGAYAFEPIPWAW